jgi:hypothetical protein
MDKQEFIYFGSKTAAYRATADAGSPLGLLYPPHQLNARASRRCTGKRHPRSRWQELLAFGLRSILVLDLGNGITGFAKGNQHSFGEMNTFFVTFRDLVPRRAVPRTGMINESGFDGACYDDKGVF